MTTIILAITAIYYIIYYNKPSQEYGSMNI
jgi:hypothetical protein